MTTTLTVARRPRGKFTRTLLAGVAGAALATGVLSSLAHAREENARIDEVTFDVTPTPFPAIVKVISNNGEKWNSIQPTEIGFDARIKIDTKGSGYACQWHRRRTVCRGGLAGQEQPESNILHASLKPRLGR